MRKTLLLLAAVFALPACDASRAPEPAATQSAAKAITTQAKGSEEGETPPMIVGACVANCKSQAQRSYLECMKPVQANYESCKALRDSEEGECLQGCTP